MIEKTRKKGSEKGTHIHVCVHIKFKKNKRISSRELKNVECERQRAKEYKSMEAIFLRRKTRKKYQNENENVKGNEKRKPLTMAR